MRFASAFACVLCLVSLTAAPAIAQDAGGAAPPQPAPPAASELPPVDVIQKKAAPRPRPRRRRARRRRSRSSPQRRTGAGRAGADGRAGAWHRRYRQRNGEHVAGRGQRDPDRQVSGCCRTRVGRRYRQVQGPLSPEVLQNTVPGVVLSDAQGNVFQRSLQYRGFDASPVNGQAQGLAVYQNGVRINESFGDIVNWDFLPDNAIEGITILGANPVYGLNATRRRCRHRHARRLQFPGRRDRHALRLVRPQTRFGRGRCAEAGTGARSSPASSSKTMDSATSRRLRSSATTPTSA